MPSDVDAAWKVFSSDCLNKRSTHENSAPASGDEVPPVPTPIYISTKTMIAHLGSNVESPIIDLKEYFWKIPILDYHLLSEGVLKKQMKYVVDSAEEGDTIKSRLTAAAAVEEVQLVGPSVCRHTYKDIRKISIGLCKKDIMSSRGKSKGAFYNCFALILRIRNGDIFKEIHIKVFNTGKLEIPGVQDEYVFRRALDLLCKTLFTISDVRWTVSRTSTVLINSNFRCNYYIDRPKLYARLRDYYKLNTSYDPCSYPGIQSEFYYRVDRSDPSGIQPSEEEMSKFSKISFMIFRTGSVLIVGKCDEPSLLKVYDRIKKILIDEHRFVGVPSQTPADKVLHRTRSKKKRAIIVPDNQ